MSTLQAVKTLVKQNGPDDQEEASCKEQPLCYIGDEPKEEFKGITPEQWAIVMAYDFSKVEYRLRKEGVIPTESIDEAIAELRKFFIVILSAREDEHPIGMISPMVDEAWHAFILHTMDYTKFCHESMGRMIHHEPTCQVPILLHI